MTEEDLTPEELEIFLQASPEARAKYLQMQQILGRKEFEKTGRLPLPPMSKPSINMKEDTTRREMNRVTDYATTGLSGAIQGGMMGGVPGAAIGGLGSMAAQLAMEKLFDNKESPSAISASNAMKFMPTLGPLSSRGGQVLQRAGESALTNIFDSGGNNPLGAALMGGGLQGVSNVLSAPLQKGFERLAARKRLPAELRGYKVPSPTGEKVAEKNIEKAAEIINKYKVPAALPAQNFNKIAYESKPKTNNPPPPNLMPKTEDEARESWNLLFAKPGKQKPPISVTSPNPRADRAIERIEDASGLRVDLLDKKSREEAQKFLTEGKGDIYGHIVGPLFEAKTWGTTDKAGVEFARRLKMASSMAGDYEEEFMSGIRNKIIEKLLTPENVKKGAYVNPDTLKVRLDAIGKDNVEKIFGKGGYDTLAGISETATRLGKFYNAKATRLHKGGVDFELDDDGGFHALTGGEGTSAAEALLSGGKSLLINGGLRSRRFANAPIEAITKIAQIPKIGELLDFASKDPAMYKAVQQKLAELLTEPQEQ